MDDPTFVPQITGLNHAVLYVRDARTAAAFYRDVMGFIIVEDLGMAVFLRGGGSTNHHDLGLFTIGSHAGPPDRGRVGLYHLAWQVATIDELVRVRDRLQHHGALTGASSHGVSKSLYAQDVDGNEFEVMWKVPVEQWGTYADHGVTEALSLETELARWSGVVTS